MECCQERLARKLLLRKQKVVILHVRQTCANLQSGIWGPNNEVFKKCLGSCSTRKVFEEVPKQCRAQIKEEGVFFGFWVFFFPLMTALESEIKHSRQKDTAGILKGIAHLYANRLQFSPIEMWTPQRLWSQMGIVYFLQIYCVLLTHYLEQITSVNSICLCFKQRPVFLKGWVSHRQCSKSRYFCGRICLGRYDFNTTGQLFSCINQHSSTRIRCIQWNVSHCKKATCLPILTWCKTELQKIWYIWNK